MRENRLVYRNVVSFSLRLRTADFSPRHAHTRNVSLYHTLTAPFPPPSSPHLIQRRQQNQSLQEALNDSKRTTFNKRQLSEDFMQCVFRFFACLLA
jgi:hypothetical protein